MAQGKVKARHEPCRRPGIPCPDPIEALKGRNKGPRFDRSTFCFAPSGLRFIFWPSTQGSTNARKTNVLLALGYDVERLRRCRMATSSRSIADTFSEVERSGNTKVQRTGRASGTYEKLLTVPPGVRDRKLDY